MKNRAASSAMAIAMVLTFGSPIAFSDTTDTSATGSNQPVTDTWITTKAKADLATTAGITPGDIAVTTRSCLVTLSGNVSSKAQVQKATATAKSEKGVHDVHTALNSRD